MWSSHLLQHHLSQLDRGDMNSIQAELKGFFAHLIYFVADRTGDWSSDYNKKWFNDAVYYSVTYTNQAGKPLNIFNLLYHFSYIKIRTELACTGHAHVQGDRWIFSFKKKLPTPCSLTLCAKIIVNIQWMATTYIANA